MPTILALNFEIREQFCLAIKINQRTDRHDDHEGNECVDKRPDLRVGKANVIKINLQAGQGHD